MSLSLREYLRHILDEARYIESHGHSQSLAQFQQDETLKRAFVRSLEIIGEAAKKVAGIQKSASRGPLACFSRDERSINP